MLRQLIICEPLATVPASKAKTCNTDTRSHHAQCPPPAPVLHLHRVLPAALQLLHSHSPSAALPVYGDKGGRINSTVE